MKDITMKKLTVIGLTGLAGAGKDAAADVLVAHAGFQKLAFAAPVRDEIAAAFGVTLLDLTRSETKEHPITGLSFRRCESPGFVGRMRECWALAGRAWNDDTLAAPRSPRQLMQLWGTEYRRHQHEAYWVNKMMHSITRARNEGCWNIVVTDVRMPNELELLRQLYGAEIWRIERPGVTLQPGAHSSETTGAEFHPDAVLTNIDGLNNLEKTVLEALMFSAGLGAEYEVHPQPLAVA